MIFAAYIPTWEGAARVLPAQMLVVGVLATALFAYAGPRHGARWSAAVLVAGLVLGWF